jgi:uncharacterized protein (DUF2147 family)
MKTLTFFLLLFFLFYGNFSAKSQSKADRVCGLYYAVEPTTGEGSQIWIYKTSSGKYEGKVLWMQHPNHPNGEPRKDVKNPDPNQRNQTNVGLVIIKGFVYNEKEDEWQNGTVYNPATGSTYRSFLRLEADGKTLKVRGYLGFSLLGKTVTWTRETEQRK